MTAAVVVIGADELRALVRDAVAEALAASRAPSDAGAPFLSLDAYAQRKGVSKRTAATWRREGMPCVLTPSGRVRVVVAEADGWVRSRVERRAGARSARRRESAAKAAEKAA